MKLNLNLKGYALTSASCEFLAIIRRNIDEINMLRNTGLDIAQIAIRLKEELKRRNKWKRGYEICISELSEYIRIAEAMN